MSRKATEIAERVRARLPQPHDELEDLLLPESRRLVAVHEPDPERAATGNGAVSPDRDAVEQGSGPQADRGPVIGGAARGSGGAQAAGEAARRTVAGSPPTHPSTH